MPYMEKDDVIKELIINAERFAEHYGGFDEGGNYCVFCGEYTEQDGITINHDPDCPITLHRQLMKLLGVDE